MSQNTQKYHEFMKDEIVKADSTFLGELLQKARQNDLKKYRYCLHDSENSNVQEMIFVNEKGFYYPPDKHDHCAETKIILYGEAWIILFEEDGSIRDMMKASVDGLRLCRVEKGIYHAVVPVSEQVIFYEMREGKFTVDMVTYPVWAPRDASEEEIKGYKERVSQAIRQWEENNV